MPGPVVFMFSGQGSHYFQMGRRLFDGNPTFRDWLVRLEAVARPSAGVSILEELYSEAHGKSDPFERTLVTHPAIFMVEYALAQALMQTGVRPDMVLGTSMGAFAAAAVAEAVDVEEALAAVIRQAVALEQHCEPGGMTAVLAAPELFEEEFLARQGTLASVNFSEHFVVSARTAELAAIEEALRRREIGFQRLAVCLPFHSRWIDGARETFEAGVRSLRRRSPRLPFVCCEQAAVLSELPEGYFWDVVRRPIRFRETLALLEQGGPRRYVDVGPAGTLATFVKYGLAPGSASSAQAVLTPYSRDEKTFAAAVASLGR